MNLDQYEEEILKAYELGELQSEKPSIQEMARLEQIASNTLKKNRRVNIRLSEHDLQAIQRRAIQEGLPYQTLISSLIHKYTNGLLVEKQHAE
jgi:predicted DNA binding CopG/RHH family protein